MDLRLKALNELLQLPSPTLREYARQKIIALENQDAKEKKINSEEPTDIETARHLDQGYKILYWYDFIIEKYGSDPDWKAWAESRRLRTLKQIVSIQEALIASGFAYSPPKYNFNDEEKADDAEQIAVSIKEKNQLIKILESHSELTGIDLRQKIEKIREELEAILPLQSD